MSNDLIILENEIETISRIDASMKNEIKVIPAKNRTKYRRIKSYCNNCKKEINDEEKLIFELLFDDDYNEIYERHFLYLLKSFIESRFKKVDDP